MATKHKIQDDGIAVKDNVPEPAASINAIVNPAPLTIAQMAILEKIHSPIVFGNIDDLGECLKALWLMSLPVREAGKWVDDDHISRVDQKAIEWASEMNGDEYCSSLSSLLKACTAFWKMLPRPEAKDAKKKDMAMGGSRKSRNGRAAHTAGR